MSKRARRTSVIAGVAAAAMLFGILTVPLLPPMPTEWKQLRVGMSREQVMAALPDSITDLRDLKGYDHVSRTRTVLGGRYHWTLTISYDEEGYLSEAHASTGNEWTGLLDQRSWKIGG